MAPVTCVSPEKETELRVSSSESKLRCSPDWKPITLLIDSQWQMFGIRMRLSRSQTPLDFAAGLLSAVKRLWQSHRKGKGTYLRCN